MTSTQSQFSPGYAIALEKVRTEVERLDAVRSRSRCFSLYGIQKATGEPLTAEGLQKVRTMTTLALESLVDEGKIISYTIHPKFEGGPEWAFIELPKRRRGSHGQPFGMSE